MSFLFDKRKGKGKTGPVGPREAQLQAMRQQPQQPGMRSTWSPDAPAGLGLRGSGGGLRGSGGGAELPAPGVVAAAVVAPAPAPAAAPTRVSSASELIQAAGAAEHAGRVAEALPLYQEGLGHLLEAAKAEANPERKQQMRERAMQYMARAEKLKQLLAQPPDPQAREPATMPASPPTADAPAPAADGGAALPGLSVSEDVVGRGANGIVYRGTLARDEGEVAVAVKMLAPGATDAEHKQFVREYETHSYAARACKGVAEVYGCGKRGDSLCLVMKLYKQSLKDFLDGRPRTRLPTAEVMAILVAIAANLAELHAANVRVQDLKPGNILMDDEVGLTNCVIIHL